MLDRFVDKVTERVIAALKPQIARLVLGVFEEMLEEELRNPWRTIALKDCDVGEIARKMNSRIDERAEKSWCYSLHNYVVNSIEEKTAYLNEERFVDAVIERINRKQLER